MTTANKPYLRRTPYSNKPWYDSNTATGALNVTFASAMGLRNLLTYTEDFSNAAYLSQLSTINTNTLAAPGGQMTADQFIEDNSSGIHQISQNANVTANSVYTFSVYVRKGTRTEIRFSNSTGGRVSLFNLDTGVVISGASASIAPAGDGWYRCIHTFTPTNTVGVTYMVCTINGGTYNYQGNGAGGFYLWGAQLEVGSTPTEYQKIVAAPSAALDPAALAATYPQNISAATNCTIACATAEGVVIADNQTVGTTFNIAPPYGYNSDVLIINRALTAAEKALVTRVFQRNMPGLGSELVVNGGFDNGTTGWLNRPYYPYGDFTVTDGIARVTGNAVDALGGIWQAINPTAVVNQQYLCKATVRAITGTDMNVRASNNIGQNRAPSLSVASTPFVSLVFVARKYEDAASSGFALTLYPGTISGVGECDNISCKEIL